MPSRRHRHARPLAAAASGWSDAAAGFEDWDLWFRLASTGVDFTIAPERTTAVLTLGAGTRRHTFGPRHAVGLVRLADEAHGQRVLDRLAEPATSCGRLPCMSMISSTRSAPRFSISVANSFLLEVKVVPASGGHVLPTGPISKAHNGRIRELLGRRHRGQLRVLTDLVHRIG